MRNEEKNLRGALIANAVFSFISGLLFMVLPQELAQLMGLAYPDWLVFIGVGLLGFAIIILLLLFKPRLIPGQVKAITYLDWGWVIGSMLLILIDPLYFTLKGLVIVAMLAMVVATLAIWQGKALGRL
ncbi:hypothetical protein R9C00_02145 [Flammeovirgaceae bacterium SG7u.111]|nr:hypothetical protein [Flammeovirgaceae bacterium SG7u.132]WPO36243.1 hypothetical protein R9C00_02145 [Flammeovirgaceae bacterium SG7u.111]